jgi:hypothetical protein
MTMNFDYFAALMSENKRPSAESELLTAVHFERAGLDIYEYDNEVHEKNGFPDVGIAFDRDSLQGRQLQCFQ